MSDLINFTVKINLDGVAIAIDQTDSANDVGLLALEKCIDLESSAHDVSFLILYYVVDIVGLVYEEGQSLSFKFIIFCDKQVNRSSRDDSHCWYGSECEGYGDGGEEQGQHRYYCNFDCHFNCNCCLMLHF